MDAALKRSRSEEPAELPPSARDLEEEEEEGMEQGLEEEEEVDPRIQVGRAGAPRWWASTLGAGLAAPGACGPGEWWLRSFGGEKRGSEFPVLPGSWGGSSARVDAA